MNKELKVSLELSHLGLEPWLQNILGNWLFAFCVYFVISMAMFLMFYH